MRGCLGKDKRETLGWHRTLCAAVDGQLVLSSYRYMKEVNKQAKIWPTLVTDRGRLFPGFHLRRHR